MRYIHNEDDPVRSAADVVAARRRSVVTPNAPTVDAQEPEVIEGTPTVAPEPVGEPSLSCPPAGLEDGKYKSRTKVGNYRPFRHRKGDNRTVPPGTRREAVSAEAAE